MGKFEAKRLFPPCRRLHFLSWLAAPDRQGDVTSVKQGCLGAVVTVVWRLKTFDARTTLAPTHQSFIDPSTPQPLTIGHIVMANRQAGRSPLDLHFFFHSVPFLFQMLLLRFYDVNLCMSKED